MKTRTLVRVAAAAAILYGATGHVLAQDDDGAGITARVHGTFADKAGGLGGTVIVNIEGGNFYDTPQSEARLAARVGEAVMSRMRQKGERF